MLTEIFIFYIGNFIGFIITMFFLFISCVNSDIFQDEILGDTRIKNKPFNKCFYNNLYRGS